MAKFKPLPSNPKFNDPAYIIASGFLDLVRIIGAKQNVFYCGNPKCGHVIIFALDAKRPIVCKRCGEGIDWVGIYTSLVKVCPSCNVAYGADDSYCSFHDPKVQLRTIEIEKRQLV